MVVWDCPGFNDTGGIVQEIANAFYIKKIFETTKNLKFILAISEASVDHRAVDVVDIVDHFSRLFDDVACLNGSVSLVITQANPQKTAVHIKNTIEMIIRENKTVQTSSKEVLGYLCQSIHMFFQPANNGILDYKTNLLSDIDSRTRYIDVKKLKMKPAISQKSKELAQTLLT